MKRPTHSFVNLSTICLNCSFSARKASTSTPTGAPITFFTYSTALGGRSGSSYRPTSTEVGFKIQFVKEGARLKRKRAEKRGKVWCGSAGKVGGQGWAGKRRGSRKVQRDT